eukprot:TRINITY_DN645_c0_g1_i1.p1 TRINITY_DN645_c0_g1~~TRINITY_DN645_c0_g1_i1.p1  ORF type:complete len:961 (+),score=267.20 TRINITY_DN645_c0_g1_i1:187-3069(+)
MENTKKEGRTDFPSILSPREFLRVCSFLPAPDAIRVVEELRLPFGVDSNAEFWWALVRILFPESGVKCKGDLDKWCKKSEIISFIPGGREWLLYLYFEQSRFHGTFPENTISIRDSLDGVDVVEEIEFILFLSKFGVPKVVFFLLRFYLRDVQLPVENSSFPFNRLYLILLDILKNSEAVAFELDEMEGIEHVLSSSDLRTHTHHGAHESEVEDEPLDDKDDLCESLKQNVLLAREKALEVIIQHASYHPFEMSEFIRQRFDRLILDKNAQKIDRERVAADRRAIMIMSALMARVASERTAAEVGAIDCTGHDHALMDGAGQDPLEAHAVDGRGGEGTTESIIGDRSPVSGLVDEVRYIPPYLLRWKVMGAFFGELCGLRSSDLADTWTASWCLRMMFDAFRFLACHPHPHLSSEEEEEEENENENENAVGNTDEWLKSIESLALSDDKCMAYQGMMILKDWLSDQDVPLHVWQYGSGWMDSMSWVLPSVEKILFGLFSRLEKHVKGGCDEKMTNCLHLTMELIPHFADLYLLPPIRQSDFSREEMDVQESMRGTSSSSLSSSSSSLKSRRTGKLRNSLMGLLWMLNDNCPMSGLDSDEERRLFLGSLFTLVGPVYRRLRDVSASDDEVKSLVVVTKVLEKLSVFFDTYRENTHFLHALIVFGRGLIMSSVLVPRDETAKRFVWKAFDAIIHTKDPHPILMSVSAKLLTSIFEEQLQTLYSSIPPAILQEERWGIDSVPTRGYSIGEMEKLTNFFSAISVLLNSLQEVNAEWKEDCLEESLFVSACHYIHFVNLNKGFLFVGVVDSERDKFLRVLAGTMARIMVRFCPVSPAFAQLFHDCTDMNFIMRFMRSAFPCRFVQSKMDLVTVEALQFVVLLLQDVKPYSEDFSIAVYLATAMARLSRIAVASIPASEGSLVFIFCRMGLEALYKSIEGLKERVEEMERIMPSDIPLTTSCDPRG